ncbi:zinc-ribbon domain-containing protein [butyrate-producing bacterium]|nr:zinc-ribbon domain-containing protein [butyrate-producing bacterium]
MGMIICPKCGKKIPDTSRKCSGCGFDGIASYLLGVPRKIDNIKREQEMKDGIKRDEEINRKRLNQAPSAPVVTCPYCHSTNTSKISAASKAGSVFLFGIFSQKVRHQWHCNECKSDF